MKILTTSLLLAASMLIACSERPKNYSCSFVDAPKIMSSLSIKSSDATLNAQVYGAMCKKVGNLVVYGATKNDCEGYKAGSNYSILIFDEVIFKVSTVLQGSGSSVSEQYACKPINTP